MGNSAGFINKVGNISQYNCGIIKNGVSKYLQLSKLLFNIESRKSVF